MTRIIGAPTLDDALAVLREQVEKSERRGEKNLIFCEDRLTLLAERAVLLSLGGTFSTEVSTFARFLSGERRVLSKQGSVVEISALISENEDKLMCFRKGAAQAVYETIAQLSASRVDEQLLLAGAQETDGILQGKLCDLAFLLEKYHEFLRENGLIDENGYLALLPEKFASEDLRGTHIFFFAFSSFTRQAQAGISAAIRHAADVTGIFLAGRTGLYTNESARIFRRLCEEKGDCAVSMVGCSLQGDALHLRDGLFSPEYCDMRKTTCVRRFTSADETEELSAVAALIKKHVAEGLRYSEIAVLVPDKDSFSTVERVFSAYRIPFFADKKRAFSEHPFCVFVSNVLAAVSSGALPDEADAIASSVYFGNGDEYRNYLLKFGGYRGAVRRNIKEGDVIKGYDRDALLSSREKMLSILACFPAKGKGSAYAAGVRALYALTDGETVTQTLQKSFSGSEKEFLGLSPLEQVLSEAETVAGESTFTAREFAAMFKSACDALEISMIPQSADAVFVGDATESKFERVKVLFATGLTDALPRSSEDTAVITDGEIERLAKLKVEIEPAIAQVNARARESLALNLCAFTEALYLSYSLKRGEEETSRGEILQYAERLFDMPPMPELFPYDCSERQPAALKLLGLRNAFESGRENDLKEFSSLYAALKERGEDVDALLSGGGKQDVPEAKELYFAGSVSPTLLERYFACPYAGFAAQALKLREREERTVLDTDTGTFVHAVLQRVSEKFNELKDEEECRSLAKDAGTELLKSPRFASLSDTDAGVYTGDRLVGEAAEVTVAAYRQLAQSSFRVRGIEADIAIPALSLKGKTDRVDVSDGYVRVIDYKTGKVDDAASAYYMGKKLQLQLYLRAAAEEGTPAGAFYFPAAGGFTAEDDVPYRMSGFYSGEDEVVTRLDPALSEGEKSLLFDGKRSGKYTERGMRQEDFEDFLDYALLVSQRAENEMKAGNISPSPHEEACGYCKLKSLCGFVGTPRKKQSVKCTEIVAVVRREKGES